MGMQFLDGFVANLSKKFSGNDMAVGVDVGTKSVKTVVLKKEGDKVILKNYSIARTEEPLIKIGQTGVINDFTGSVVREALEEAGIKERQINVAIPSFTSLIITIEVSRIAGKEFEAAIRREVSKYIPVKIEDVVYDWQIIDESQLSGAGTEEEKNDVGQVTAKKAGGMVKILVIAIMKEISRRYDEVFSANKLAINLLEIDSISLTRALTHNKAGVYLILDIGHETTNILVASQQGVLMNRTIDVGGDKMTQVIADSMKIDFKRAEQIKREQGVNVAVTGQAGGVLTTVLSIITGEIKKTIQLFKTDFSDADINKILLSGGSASMIGLRELIQQQSGIETSVGNALEGIAFVPEIKDVLLHNAPSLTIAIGLALANFEE
jgi:type IV pilus assembly protein PilM